MRGALGRRKVGPEALCMNFIFCSFQSDEDRRVVSRQRNASQSRVGEQSALPPLVGSTLSQTRANAGGGWLTPESQGGSAEERLILEGR